eukprot:7377112-Prymnesium_polylepis.1
MVTVVGSCVQSGNCITSPGFPSDYGLSESCTIYNLPAVAAEVLAFDVEPHDDCDYDYVSINGARFCGASGPAGIIPTDGQMTWHSDIIQAATGWRICFSEAIPPAQPDELPPPAPPGSPPPLPPLSAGDCMVIGFNSDGSSSDFAIVLLAPLRQGCSISVTDDGWNSAFNDFQHLESHAMHTAASLEPAGTVLTTSDFDTFLTLHDRSDQLLVYQGTYNSPTFVCALDNSGGFTLASCPGTNGGWNQADCTQWGDHSGRQYYSSLPPGLTQGIDALAWMHRDNWAYSGAVTGSPSELRAQIARLENWTSSNSNPQPFLTTFNVRPEQPPAPPLPPPEPGYPPTPPYLPMPPSVPPPPPLSAGDCMVVGYSAGVSFDFAIVLLASLAGGQAIMATNAGWHTDITPNAFVEEPNAVVIHEVQLHINHTARTEHPAGTVLAMADFSGSLYFSAVSDQLIVYQGSKSRPTFLCAFDNSGGVTTSDCPGSTGGWHQAICSTDNSRGFQLYSSLPPGLSAGADALAWTHRDYWTYADTATGSPSELRAKIAQSSSWLWSNQAPQPFITSFAVHPEPPPAAPPPPAPPGHHHYPHQHPHCLR